MLNTGWVAGVPLNQGAPYTVVSFAANVSATAVCTEADFRRRRIFASTKTAVATGECTVTRNRRFFSTRSAVATHVVDLTVTRKFGSQVAAFATSLLGGSFSIEFGSQVNATAVAELLPFDALFDTDVDALATADPVELVRTRRFAANASCAAVATALDSDTIIMYRGFGSSVTARATSAADPDIIVDGTTRYAGLSCATTATATHEATILISARMSANASATAVATPVTALTVNRQRQLLGGTHLVQAIAEPVDMVSSVPMASSRSASATSVAQVGKFVKFASTKNAAATSTCKIPALAPARMKPVAVNALATTQSQLSAFKGFSAQAFGIATSEIGPIKLAWKFGSSVSASASSEVTAAAGNNIAIKFASAVQALATYQVTEAAGGNFARHFASNVSANATFDLHPDAGGNYGVLFGGQVNANATFALDGYFTIRRAAAAVSCRATTIAQVVRNVHFDADVDAVATAIAELRTNIFDDEPDYRTVFVALQDVSILVGLQDFTLYVTDDGRGMKTFTKQPGDKLPYDIDLTDWFSNLEGDDIESASVVVVSASAGDPSDLVVEQPLLLDSPSYRVKVWIDEGIDGATYKLTLTIDTEGGRRKEVDFRIKVKEG